MPDSTSPTRRPLGDEILDVSPSAPANMVFSVMNAIKAEQMSAAPVVGSRRRSLRSLWQRLAVACTLLVTVSAGLGASTASAAALPGDALYSVRMLREHTAMALAPSATGRAALAAGYAQDRLDAMHRIILTHGNSQVALGLMNDAVSYNQQAARTQTPWMRQVLIKEYRAARADCSRITSDPLWQRMSGGKEFEQAMDNHLDSFQTLITK